jgi:hypothetical protein
MSATQVLTEGGTLATRVPVNDSLLKRVLLLYGLYTLLNNAAFLTAYYFLPEGFLRGSAVTTSGQIVANQGSFWGQFATTLLFNIGWMVTLSVLLNFNQVRGFPMGYLLPISIGIVTGLILGSNSFVSSNVDQYGAREGLALGTSIGGLETLGYILIIAATVRLGIYQYRSWWRWSRDWAPTKLMRIRDIRLSGSEWLTIAAGLLLIILGAYRETLMAFGLL